MQDSREAKKTIDVIAVGQTPPPVHGQAIMIKMLLDGKMEGVRLHHIRMGFSENMDQVGRVQFGKVFHLVSLILQIWFARFRYGATILYYPPAGANRVPVYRDILLLLSTRWIFRKTIFHFHAGGVSELIPTLRQPIRLLAQLALFKPSSAIQLSELTVADGVGLKAKKIFIVPNAAYDDAAELGWRPEDRKGASIRNLLYVGTVCEGKGVLLLLEACKRLEQAGIDFHLYVVGSYKPSDFESTVRDFIQANKLDLHVTLHGQKTGKEKLNIFAKADIFCFPSHYAAEGFPCVLLEAMCFALPIISTLWRGIPSIVDDRRTGILIPLHDVDGLFKSLQEMLSNTDQTRGMGRLGRDKFLALYSTEQHLQQMRNVFIDTAD